MSKKGNVVSADSVSIEGSLHEDEQEIPRHPIAIVLGRFLDAIDDYRSAALITLPAVSKNQIEELRKVSRKIEKFVAKVNEDGSKILKAECAHDVKEMSDAIETADRIRNSKPAAIVKKSFFIGLFSEFDHFVGDLLKAIYATNPLLYKGIRREIALTDLLEFTSMEEIKRDMLEKEIDTFRRDSYIEQFSELEKKFEIKTLRAFCEWPIFVEMAQRRNLLTHNGGRVSQQYLTICAKEKVPFAALPRVGDTLELDLSYLADAMLTVSKIGFMLAHTLWRKVVPNELDAANEEMNSAIYGLLKQKRWRVAAAFGEFALTEPMRKGLKDLDFRIRLMNQAIALKKQGKVPESNTLIQSVDWSASIREFSLARAVLEERYGDAAQLMKSIGKEGELITEIGYHSWPLFEDFRGTVDFQTAYEEIYGVPFHKKVSETVVQQEACQTTVAPEVEKPTEKKRRRRSS